MKRRGRPRYPDILTARQWEVLELLRQGLTNEQIADRLGITLDGAKFHVSEILGRLGLSSREEAAAWRPEEGRPWWASTLAFLGWPLRHLALSMVAKGAAAAVLVAAAGGIGVLAWGVVATRGPEDEGQPAAVETPTATPGTVIRADVSDWKVYRNERYGFELSYPPDAALTEDSTRIGPPVSEGNLVQIDLPFSGGTNLARKYLVVTARDTSGEECSNLSAEGYEPGSISTDFVRINGMEFKREAFTGAAAGSIYERESYSITRGSLCVSLSFVLHSSNPGNYPTPPPEFDKEEESQIFQPVAYTFRWIDG